MRAPLVGALEPFLKALALGGQRAVLKQVNPLVFHAPPKPLDENLVPPSPFAVHPDFHSKIGQSARPFRRRELTTLFVIEDLWDLASGTQGHLRGLQAKFGSPGVGSRPAEHLARFPVHHCAQVRVASMHSRLGDVGAPHSVGPLDDEVAQQEAMHAVTVVWNAGSWLAPDRLLADLAPQTHSPFAIRFNVVIVPQHRHQTSTAKARILQGDFIQQPFETDVFRVLIHRFAGDRGTRHA